MALLAQVLDISRLIRRQAKPV